MKQMNHAIGLLSAADGGKALVPDEGRRCDLKAARLDDWKAWVKKYPERALVAGRAKYR